LHLGLLFRLLGNCYRSYFLRSCMMQMYKCSCLGALQRWQVMIMMNRMSMNRFTLLYKVGIQLFNKVVHIIQEHVLVYYYKHTLPCQVTTEI
jgi:hypothetical protein